jgi:hypothetical protein
LEKELPSRLNETDIFEAKRVREPVDARKKDDMNLILMNVDNCIIHPPNRKIIGM